MIKNKFKKTRPRRTPKFPQPEIAPTKHTDTETSADSPFHAPLFRVKRALIRFRGSPRASEENVRRGDGGGDGPPAAGRA